MRLALHLSIVTTVYAVDIALQKEQQIFGNGFVTVSKTGFERHGQPYYIAGANYWQGMNLASDESVGGNISRLEKELTELENIGINNLRIMAGSEGPDDQPFRMRPSLMPSPGQYNEHILAGLDYLLDAMDRHSMTAVVTLNNFWHWSGGFAQYVNWADHNTSIPYPPSWMPDPENRYSNGSYNEFFDYASRFYKDQAIASAVDQMFKNHIDTILYRRNTVNGKIYGEDPVIMAWELANEPQLAPKEWTNDIAAYIKQRAPQQLVTAGIEGKYGYEDFWNTHSSVNIDYTTCHLWVENWGVYNPSDQTDASLQKAFSYAEGFIHNCSDWAVGMGKPVVLEEFGMARDAWRNPSEPLYKYNPGTPVTNKDRYYEHIFKIVEKLAFHGAFSGANFWAYSGEGYPSQPANEFEMVWLGDPQHEPRGWYGVYHNDTTMSVIKDYARNISANSRMSLSM